jgi:hypothetical protein
MTWPVKDADLSKLGRAIVKAAKGLVTRGDVGRGSRANGPFDIGCV